MAPLAWMLARLLGAHYWLQAHGVDIWTPATRRRARLPIEAADMVTHGQPRHAAQRLLGWADLPPGSRPRPARHGA